MNRTSYPDGKEQHRAHVFTGLTDQTLFRYPMLQHRWSGGAQLSTQSSSQFPYLDEFTSEKAWGEEGYLTDKGMIPMPDVERKEFRENVKNRKTITK